MTDAGSLDQDRVADFQRRVVVDSGAAKAGLSTSLGGRLGLYSAMAGAGPLTSAQLAERSGLVERYVREWLAVQVAGEYVRYDPGGATYELPDEHAAVLADASSPTYAMGTFTMLKALFATEDALAEAFRTGEGVGWAQHAPELFEGVAAFFRPGYTASLVQEWLPALGGVVEKLERGASVADIGCGHGYSALLMAEAFPRSEFHGYDFHGPSIEAARKLAAERGLGGRATFDVAAAGDFPGERYDLITFFDCLHDLGDPGAALRRTERALADDGTCMIVEPNVSGNVEDTINPVGRSFAATSVAVCLPAALAQKGPHALGNHAGEDAMRAIAAESGLRTWTLAAETVSNRIYAARR
ncbi:class I SAM-dependent methyltransferase [Amycolatopsis sp. NPDC047767]|uniref:class I SAM-dependent methyltransferase n=1 Tax=Amycolatopsis sp. NPDC047767 TaxID=3156765 RepID=UPI003454DA38